MDQRLPLVERIGLKMHLAICRNCRRFTVQLELMRRLFHEEAGASDSSAGLSPEARRRIATELQKTLDT